MSTRVAIPIPASPAPAPLPAPGGDYNYGRFQPAYYDLASFPGPRVGETAPDVAAVRAEDGAPVRLSDFRGRTVVLETGSLTCPMYVKNIPAMRALARAHPDVAFLVLYVREAHPGERVPAHRTTAEKRACAARLPASEGETRRILVDDVVGTAHRAYGGLPDMVYVVGPDGQVRFRGDWTEPAAVEAALAPDAEPALLTREHFEPAKPAPPLALRVLWRAGAAAVLDFVVGLPGLLALHRKARERYGRR